MNISNSSSSYIVIAQTSWLITGQPVIVLKGTITRKYLVFNLIIILILAGCLNQLHEEELIRLVMEAIHNENLDTASLEQDHCRRILMQKTRIVLGLCQHFIQCSGFNL